MSFFGTFWFPLALTTLNCYDVKRAFKDQSCCNNRSSSFTIPSTWDLDGPVPFANFGGFTWVPDDMKLSTSRILKYVDDGSGWGYSNLHIDLPTPIDFQTQGYIQIDVFVESRSGSSSKTLAVKMQEDKPNPWEGQIVIEQPYTSVGVWETLTFDFGTKYNPGNYGRRIVFQMDGENNNDPVTAYFSNFRMGRSPTIAGCLQETATNYDPNATVQLTNQYGDIKCNFSSCSDVPENLLGACLKDGWTAVTMTNNQATPCVNWYGGHKFCPGPPPPPPPPSAPEANSIAAGDWKLNFLGVGSSQGDFSWWSLHPLKQPDGPARSCYFDDIYRFGDDGTFKNVMGNETWVEPWQEGVTSAGCGSPVAPHDGSKPATFHYNPSSQILEIHGEGAFIGLSKIHNTGEDGYPVNNTITYIVNSISDTYLNVDIVVNTGTSIWWKFGLNKIQ